MAASWKKLRAIKVSNYIIFFKWLENLSIYFYSEAVAAK